MRARDLLRDFHNANTATPDDMPLRQGIVSDVFGTLIKRDELNVSYYKFLLWAQERGIPITITSSEPLRAARALQAHGCDDSIAKNIQDKIHTYSGRESLEVVIDDEMVLAPALIVINPNNARFCRFLATAQYKKLTPQP